MPASHVYVRHLADPAGGDRVTRLDDVVPADGRRVPDGAWPPLMLDAGWIRAHREAFDVFHVHFGFDAKSPGELAAAGEALREAGIPLVVTVHDLRNPRHADQALHDAQLDALLAAAAAVVTLTPGAAAEIARRWGRDAVVLPHPHVVDEELLDAPRPAHRGFVVGLHAKSLRANMDAPAVARALAPALAALPAATLRIDLHDEVFDPAHPLHAPAAGRELRALARRHPHVELREHPYFTDAELWRYLREIDVSVLPYRYGTHSGWLEACHDLGTTLIAPSCGFYGEQRPCLLYTHDDAGLDPSSLARAAEAAFARGPAPRPGRAARMRERAELARAHRALYERVLAA